MQPPAIKAISKDLIDLFAREGVRVPRPAALDLLFGALGFWRAKLANEYGTPFVFGPPHPEYRAAPAYLHLRNATELIQKFLHVDEWKAQQLAALLFTLVRESGLRVDTQAVLFEEGLAGTRDRILKALKDPDFPPVHASVAIGAGTLPEPPKSLAEHLVMMGPQRPMGPGSFGTMAEVVAAHAIYLLRKVPRQGREFEPAFFDWLSRYDDSIVSAELGMGFCLLQPEVVFGRPLVHVFSPHLHFHWQKSESRPVSEIEWRMSGIHSTSYRETDVLTRAPRPLVDLIGSPVTELPRAEVCPACLAIFVREKGVAPHRCPVIGPDAARLLDVLRGHFDRDDKSFTAKELHGEVRPRQGNRAGTLSVEALQTFLHTNRATLGLRSFEDVWTLVRRPTIKLATSETSVAAVQHAGA